MNTLDDIDSRTLRLWLLQLIVGLTIVCCIAGCEEPSMHGRQLFKLENATRTWTVPKREGVDLSHAARIVIDESEIDFGNVEPDDQTTREFTVHNVGANSLSLKRIEDDSPLVVTAGKSVDKFSIKPGRTLKIRVSWTPEISIREREEFSLKFRTNDPRQPKVGLPVFGVVRSAVFVDPPVLHAGRARPDKSTPMKVLVLSQRWQGFDISSMTSDFSGMDLRVVPVAADTLRKYRAKSGWELHAALPAGLSPGAISGKQVSLQLKPVDGEGPLQQLEIPLRANVLRRVAVYGEKIDKTGTISFGVLPYKQQHKLCFTVKVHDSNPALAVRGLHVSPTFLDVKLEPYQDSSVPKNLYRLTVILPPSAPPSVHRMERQGQIKFEFDHPRISELTLNVDFALTGEARHVLAGLGGAR